MYEKKGTVNANDIELGEGVQITNLIQMKKNEKRVVEKRPVQAVEFKKPAGDPKVGEAKDKKNTKRKNSTKSRSDSKGANKGDEYVKKAPVGEKELYVLKK